jgi:ABC-type branched-subunit amino acid transport system substrate-binding protein
MYISDSLTMNATLRPSGQQFLRALRAEQHGTQPASGAYLPETAQLAELVLDAVAHSNGTRASVLDALRRAKVVDGMLGTFSFDRNGDKIPATFTIVRVTGTGSTPGLAADFRGSTVDRAIQLPASLVNP